MAEIHDRGRAGEDRAAAFLAEQGFSILERNFRYGKNGEIDIIARKDDLVIFVEVRVRSTRSKGGALESLTPAKMARMRSTAEAFIASRPEGSLYRFDLIALERNELQWIEDILR
jgi:putative endonuclease